MNTVDRETIFYAVGDEGIVDGTILFSIAGLDDVLVLPPVFAVVRDCAEIIIDIIPFGNVLELH